MNPALFQMPFVQVALPLPAGMFIAVWSNNKAFEMLNKRFDATAILTTASGTFTADSMRLIAGSTKCKRLDRIETKLDSHEGRIIKLEAETTLVKR